MIPASLIDFKEKKCTQFISFFVAFCDHLVFFLGRNKLLFFYPNSLQSIGQSSYHDPLFYCTNAWSCVDECKRVFCFLMNFIRAVRANFFEPELNFF